MARRSVEPSTISLLGLVRHLAEMERGTFRELMAGQDVPRLYCSADDRDGDFDGAIADPEVVAEAWTAWRAEVDFATRFVAGAPDGQPAGECSKQPGHDDGSGDRGRVVTRDLKQLPRKRGMSRQPLAAPPCTDESGHDSECDRREALPQQKPLNLVMC